MTAEEETRAVIDVKNHIRKSAAYPGTDIIVNCDSRIGMDGTVEMWLNTGLTWQEMERISEKYPIVEIYGFDADHFHGEPKARETIGLIVQVE